MFYLIPSWYDKDRQWHQQPPLWFRVFERLTFDDTVNQLKMFQLAEEPARLLQLAYNPHFRYFLHKQGLQTVSYWSFFDDIQNCHQQPNRTLHFKELNWPQGTSFIYTPFKVIAKKQEEYLADLHFAENGNLYYIDRYQQNQVAYRYVFDDRGFLSSLIVYDNGKALYQDYLNPLGVWQVREWLKEDKQILEINPQSDRQFQQASYANWEELIAERLTAFKAMFMTAEDAVVIAANHQHNNLLLSVFDEQEKIVSFSSQRQGEAEAVFLAELAHSATMMVTDAQELKSRVETNLKQLGIKRLQVAQITPFDTRLRLGRSQTIKEQILYFLIDGLTEKEYRNYLKLILDKMAADKSVYLKVISYDHQRNMDLLKNQLLSDLSAAGRLEDFLVQDAFLGENQLEEDAEMQLKSISFEKFTTEEQIIKSLDTARLVLDFAQVPNAYTQIASISAGLPQINKVSTDYVIHKENGWVISEPSQLTGVLDYYLDSLTNWNRSLVYAVQKMGDYTSGRLIEQWKELLDKKEE